MIWRISLISIFLFFSCAGSGFQDRKKKGPHDESRLLQVFFHNSQIDSTNFEVDCQIEMAPFPILFKKNDNGFSAKLQISIRVSDSLNSVVYNNVWSEGLIKKFFEETRKNEPIFISSHSFSLPRGKYKANLSVFDLNSKYSWQQNRRINLNKKRVFNKITAKVFENDSLEIVNESIPGTADTLFFHYQLWAGSLQEKEKIQLELETGSGKSYEFSFPLEVNSNREGLISLALQDDWMGFLHFKFNYAGEMKDILLSRFRSANDEFLRELMNDFDAMVYIMEFSEFKEAKELAKEKRFQFLQEWWKAKDPSPDSDANELLLEFYSRLRYVNREFTVMREGWRSDRGRIFLQYGPPYSISVSGESGINPLYIAWKYKSGDQFIFKDNGFGDYRIVSNYF